MDANGPEWKAGTEALALCIICGSKHAPDTAECPDCHVSLSAVRCCPECQRMVSAQHTRCVYCRTSFTHELSQGKDRPLPPLGFATKRSPFLVLFRVIVVSVGTFAFVFLFGILFLRAIHRPADSHQVVARSHALDSANILRSPSSRSSIVGIVGSETPLSVTGTQANSRGRWMVLQWKKQTAYLPAEEMAAPLASDQEGGAAVLQFFIEGANSADALSGAALSVDQYVKSFPVSPTGGELRWLLAKRMQALAERGGSQSTALRRAADTQLKLLAASEGPFAAKARALTGKGSREKESSPSTRGPKQIEIVDEPRLDGPGPKATRETSVNIEP